MPYDSLVMAAAASELTQSLVGGRVVKIYQPDHFTVTLRFHTAEANLQLLLSPIHDGRAQLTQQAGKPGQPALFCMSCVNIWRAAA